ncbi:hypothetical protein N8T08_007230, partial [Aspergillus melleus]
FVDEEPEPVPEPEFVDEEPESVPEPEFVDEEPEPVPEPEFVDEEPESVPEPEFVDEEPEPVPEPEFVDEEPEPFPTEPPAEGEFEQCTIPQASPNTEGWPSASLSLSDTPNHEQAQGHIARITCADLMLYKNWESLSSKYKKKRAIKLASKGLPIPSEDNFLSIIAI